MKYFPHGSLWGYQRMSLFNVKLNESKLLNMKGKKIVNVSMCVVIKVAAS
jgi:hypothetical protein